MKMKGWKWKGRWNTFPLVRQKDSNDCGPACLRMLLKYYQLPELSSENLRALCRCSGVGVSLADLLRSADHLGFDAEAGKYADPQSLNKEFPLLLLWNRSHYVICYDQQQSYYHIADPAVGLLKVHEKDMEDYCISPESGSGIYVKCRPRKLENRRDESVRSSRGNAWRWVLPYLRQIRPNLPWLFCCFVLSALFSLLLPLFFQLIVDVAVGQSNVQVLWVFLAAQVALYLGQLSAEIVRTWIVLRVGAEINLTMVSGFLLRLVGLPQAFFSQRMLGDILQRVDDHKRIERFLLGPALEAVMSVFQVLVLSILLLHYSFLVFLLIGVVSLMFYLWYMRFWHERVFWDYEMFRREAAHRSLLVELIESIQEIKLSGAEQLKVRHWESTRRQCYGTQVRAVRSEEKQNVGIVLLGIVRDVLISAWVCWLAIRGLLTIGELFSIQFVVGQLGEPVRKWLAAWRAAQDALLSRNRIEDVMEEPRENVMTVWENLRESEGAKLFFNDCKIRLEDVCFGYAEQGSHRVLSDIRMEIGPGMNALVGRSGCGKTSLLKLLLALYSCDSGNILVNDVPLANLPPNVWRPRCGVVLQDGYIFSDTILANVAPQLAEPDQVLVQECLKLACLWDWVSALPKAMNTKVGREGIAMSQGQRQRLLMARALYKKPQVLFLDEATNALDVHTEGRLWENVKPLFERKTVLVIAHRLSTVVDAKRIFVMEEGRIVESGCHEELLERRGVYFELIKNQMGL